MSYLYFNTIDLLCKHVSSNINLKRLKTSASKDGKDPAEFPSLCSNSRDFLLLTHLNHPAWLQNAMNSKTENVKSKMYGQFYIPFFPLLKYGRNNYYLYPLPLNPFPLLNLTPLSVIKMSTVDKLQLFNTQRSIICVAIQLLEHGLPK